MANIGEYYICFKEFSVFHFFLRNFCFNGFSPFLLGPLFDLQLRIILSIDKLQDNCDKSERLWQTLGPSLRGWPCRWLMITWRKNIILFNRDNGHVGEIKEVDYLGTVERGREKVGFAQAVKVTRSWQSARLVHFKILMLGRLRLIQAVGLNIHLITNQ